MLLGVGAGPSYAELVSPPPLPWSLDPQRRLMRSLAASATACAGGAVPLAGAAVLADAAGPPSLVPALLPRIRGGLETTRDQPRLREIRSPFLRTGGCTG